MIFQYFGIFYGFFDNVAVVIDTDGSAFITKAEFDSLKNNFQAQIDSYNSSIDSKIDGAIAGYLAGIQLVSEIPLELCEDSFKNIQFWDTFRYRHTEYTYPNPSDYSYTTQNIYRQPTGVTASDENKLYNLLGNVVSNSSMVYFYSTENHYMKCFCQSDPGQFFYWMWNAVPYVTRVKSAYADQIYAAEHGVGGITTVYGDLDKVLLSIKDRPTYVYGMNSGYNNNKIAESSSYAFGDAQERGYWMEMIDDNPSDGGIRFKNQGWDSSAKQTASTPDYLTWPANWTYQLSSISSWYTAEGPGTTQDSIKKPYVYEATCDAVSLSNVMLGKRLTDYCIWANDSATKNWTTTQGDQTFGSTVKYRLKLKKQNEYTKVSGDGGSRTKIDSFPSYFYMNVVNTKYFDELANFKNYIAATKGYDLKLGDGIPLFKTTMDGIAEFTLTFYLSSSTLSPTFDLHIGPFNNISGNGDTLRLITETGGDGGYAQNIPIPTSTKKVTCRIQVNAGETVYLRCSPNDTTGQYYVRMSDFVGKVAREG